MPPGDRTLHLDAESGPAALAAVAERAIGVLEAGGTVIVPTDTVYGVAAHPEHAAGLDQLFALKDRDRSKAMAVLAADADQALGLFAMEALAGEVAAAVTAMASTTWPGGLTVVGPRSDRWRHVELGGDATTIGVRVPDSVVVRTIAARVGPIVTTSANRSGDPTPTDADAAARSLLDDVGLVVDAGPCGGLASTVVDVTVTPFRIVRRGAVDPAILRIDPRLLAADPAATVGANRE